MRMVVLMAAVASLAACGRQPQYMAAKRMDTFDIAPPGIAGPSAPAPAAGPRIAYSHAVTYAFDRRIVAQVQGRQLALCRELGPARCLVVKSTLNAPGPDDHVVTDEAILLIEARTAGAINARLDAIAVTGGARVATRQVEAEDVTKQAIDADAKVRAKEALAGRLLAIVRDGKGNVGELVQAERAYAQTQEELDAARGEQAELAQRVAMSRVTITYAFDDTPGRGSPIGASVAAAGDTLATSIATLVTAIVALLPWLVAGALAITGLRWVRRKRGWRWPRRGPRRAPPVGEAVR